MASIEILRGDALDVLAALPDQSADAVITDPPYAFAGGFMGKSWDAFDGREDAGFCYWLSGLIDGEGHFAIKAHTRGTHAPYFRLKMRADEVKALEQIRRTIGVGQIDLDTEHEPNPMAMWTVADKAGCQRIVDLLDKYPLRAKKRIDYITWRAAVCEWTDRPRGNRWHGPSDNSRMAGLRRRLMEGRKYQDVAWSGNEFQDWVRLWAWECFRILKPGGYLAAFGSPRAYHRLACGIEDAGFEIRDSLTWLTGQGYPKSIDGEREVARTLCKAPGRHFLRQLPREEQRRDGDHICESTPESRRFLGVGSALKPAHEPIVLARRPMPGTIGRNLLEHGIGGLHVDQARIGMSDQDAGAIRRMTGFGKADYDAPLGVSLSGSVDGSLRRNTDAAPHNLGRWPSNLVLTHAPDCRRAGTRQVKNNGTPVSDRDTSATRTVYGKYSGGPEVFHGGADGSEDVEAWLCVEGCPVLELDRQSGESDPESVAAIGGASRYFTITAWTEDDLDERFRYEPKASSAERDRGCEGLSVRTPEELTGRKPGSAGLAHGRAGTDRAAKNHHPTVKPVGLMRWLVRLLTKPGDRVIDPFFGSGTTGVACKIEGVDCVGIEREAEYVEIASLRVEAVAQPAMLALAERDDREAEQERDTTQMGLFK